MDAREAFAVSGGCCTPAAFVSTAGQIDPTFVRVKDDGTGIDSGARMHCAACIGRIEDGLSAPRRHRARANLTSHRVGIDFDAAAGDPDAMLAAIEGARLFRPPFDASPSTPRAATRSAAISSAAWR
jgi:Cu2+-exporting ATPase